MQDDKKAILAREVEKIEREKLTAKMELHWKDGRLAGVSYKDLPVVK